MAAAGVRLASAHDAGVVLSPVLLFGVVAAGFCSWQWRELCNQLWLAALCWTLGFTCSLAQPGDPAEQSAPPRPRPPPQLLTRGATPASAAPAPAAPAPAAAARATALIVQLRKLLAPTPIGDEEAARFLVARRGDVAKAAKLFASNAQWRKAEDIDGILTEMPLQPAEREEVRATAQLLLSCSRVRLSLTEPLARLSLPTQLLVRNFNPVVLDGCDRKGRPIIFVSVGRLEMDLLARNGVTVKLILRRQLRALEAVARMMAVRHERQYEHNGALNGGEGSPGIARRYLFIIDVTDGTVGRFLSGWKLWASIASYEAQYYPALVRARGRRPAAFPRSHDDSALA